MIRVLGFQGSGLGLRIFSRLLARAQQQENDRSLPAVVREALRFFFRERFALNGSELQAETINSDLNH